MIDAAAAQALHECFVVEPAAASVRDEACGPVSASLARKMPPPIRPSFGGVLQLQHDAIVLLRHELQRGDGVGIVQIAEHDDQAAIFQHAREFAHAPAERRAFIEAIRAASRCSHRKTSSRESVLCTPIASLAAADDADRADPREAGERQPAGELHRPRVFAEPLRGDAHRRRRIDQQIDRHPLRRLVLLHVDAAGAGRDAPVDRLDRIARLIEARLHVLDARAEERRASVP